MDFRLVNAIDKLRGIGVFVTRLIPVTGKRFADLVNGLRLVDDDGKKLCYY